VRKASRLKLDALGSMSCKLLDLATDFPRLARKSEQTTLRESDVAQSRLSLGGLVTVNAWKLAK
jgi:hypothetical protein